MVSFVEITAKIIANPFSAKMETPSTFFSRHERKILQAYWGASTDKWVDLPGPSHWWPDVLGKDLKQDRMANQWYRRHGFDLPSHDQAAYRKALKFVRSKRPPPGDWVNNLIHPDGDLVWITDELL